MALTIIRALVDPMAAIQSIAVPGFVRFLSVATVPSDRRDDSGNRIPVPAVFALGDLDQPAMSFSLRMFHTGGTIPDAMAPTLEFVGTAASRDGSLACHIFQVVRPPAPDPVLGLDYSPVNRAIDRAIIDGQGEPP